MQPIKSIIVTKRGEDCKIKERKRDLEVNLSPLFYSGIKGCY
jgi:hypothetical protein